MRSPAALSLRVSTLLAVIATAAALCVATGAHAASGTERSYGARLLELVNNARVQHGMRPLVLVSGTTTVALTWTQHMATQRFLSHNPDLGPDLSNHGSTHWHQYGENVGMGAADDPDGLFTAYMRSPEHRANILHRAYRFVGVAVVLAGSRSWNTVDFVDVYRDASSPARTPTPVRAQSSRPPRPTTTSGSVALAARPALAPHRRAPSSVAPRRVAPQRMPAHRASPIERRHSRIPVVRVEGLHQLRLQPAAAPIVQLPTPQVSTVSGTHDQRPADRSHEVVVALAVIALAAAARRWVLIASPAT